MAGYVGCSDSVVINVLTYINGVILSIISFLQSAVICLQWPAEYIIVFGLAEGKVREGPETQERLWVGTMLLERGIWLIFSLSGEYKGAGFFFFLFLSLGPGRN